MKGDQMGILAAYPTQRELPLSNQTRFSRCGPGGQGCAPRESRSTKGKEELLGMTEAPALPATSTGTALTRFNALRHGVLSRYTLLPWEDEGEYQDIVSALVSEHQPSGPTEEHLVEELA